MSGTGLLVKVLQAALAEEHRKRMGVNSAEARLKAKTLIENVHVFAKYYAEDNTERPPSNHVILFDEAQRGGIARRTSAKLNGIAVFASPEAPPVGAAVAGFVGVEEQGLGAILEGL